MTQATINWQEQARDNFYHYLEQKEGVKAENIIEYFKLHGEKTLANDMFEDLVAQTWWCDMCNGTGNVELSVNGQPDDLETKKCPYCV